MSERLAQLWVELATGDDHPCDRVADVPRHLVEQEGGGLEVDRGDRGQWPPFPALQRQRVGCRDGALDRDRRQRLAPGQVEVDRPGARLAAAAASARQATSGNAAARRHRPRECRLRRTSAPSAVELDLVDRLARADPAQLRRPVGGEHDQRQRRLVRLADRRVVVGRRGARGAEQRDRRAGSPARRQARRTPPSARRRSRPPRSPPVARAPPPTASSASRGRPPRAAPLPARAPRRKPRRARCCVGRVQPGGNLEAGAPASASSSISTPRPGPAREVEHAVAQLALDRGDGRGEEPLGGEPVGEARRVWLGPS